MQPRILTRYTTIAVFLITCCLTFDVNARERDLAPILSPEAWKLLSDAQAIAQGFTPAVVTPAVLKARTPVRKTSLVKRPNSRVKVKFSDALQIRLDVHSKPYSRTQRASNAINDICETLNITLTPTITRSQEDTDALIRRAELASQKQQPDIGGVYWVNGDSASVDVAAELFFAMDEVEWVIYKPVYSKLPKPSPKPNVITTQTQPKAQTRPVVEVFGACQLTRNLCVEHIELQECNNQGGTFLGQNSICYSAKESENRMFGPVAGECCVLIDCTAVADEAACLLLNGIYMGENTDDPVDPCGASQADCPAGQGPLFNTYNACAQDGEVISFFTGDCYIDQTAVDQTARPPADGSLGYPIGCGDTDGELGGPAGVDYVVRTGLPAGVPSNIKFGSQCCEIISADVPDCAAGPWNAICAGYAQAYALNGSGNCERNGSDPTPPNACFTALGPTIDPATVQPATNMNNVLNAGSGIMIMNDGTSGIGTAMVDIIDNTGGNCEDGGCELNLYTDLGGLTETFGLIEGLTLGDLSIVIDGAGDGWGTQVNGDMTMDLTLLQPRSQVTAFDSTLDTPVVPQSFTGVRFQANKCFSPSGAPTYPRATTTPDYAALGLLAWMSPAELPWAGSLAFPPQLSALPAYSNTLTTNDFTHIYQLMPWPIGGASAQDATLRPPLSTSFGNLGWWGGDGGINLFPAPGNPGGFGQQDVYQGSIGYAQMWEDDSIGQNGAYGNGVKVAVLDWSAHVQQRTNNAGVNMGGIHEEFLMPDNTTLKVKLEGTATGHDNLTLIFDENQNFGYSADHGTAVLGVIAARWNPTAVVGDSLATRLTNNVGVLGLVPDADVYFFPLATVDAPDREEQAWFNALEVLEAGDVICAAYRPVAVGAANPNLNFWDDTSSWLEIANNLGICTVIRSGDLGIDVGGLDLPGDDHNVIVATAVTPGAPFKRFCDGTRGSNFAAGSQGNYSAVTASGWGLGVITCGKGQLQDNFIGYNTITYSDPTDAHIVHAQAYTNNFGYSGSAAAQVAGIVAQVQGFTKQVFGIGMGPQICRQLIAGGKYEGRDRDGNPVLHPAPSVSTEEGIDSSCETVENLVDWDFCPGAGNLTGNLLDPRRTMVNVILNPIFDTPNIDTIMVVRGNRLMGNRYSVSAQDGNLFGIEGMLTSANRRYLLPSGVIGSSVRYPFGGDITDIYLAGDLQSAIPANDLLTIEIDLEETQPDQFYLRCEMWDFRRRSWEQASGTTIVAQGTITVDLEVESASRFIDDTTFEYHLRLTTIVSNLPGDGSIPTLPIHYDQILVKTGLTQVPRP